MPDQEMQRQQPARPLGPDPLMTAAYRVAFMIVSHQQVRAGVAAGAILFAVVGFCVLFRQMIGAVTPQADDGWRRTSAGWEKATAWAAPPPSIAAETIAAKNQSLQPSRSSQRWDTHPAALALVQIAAVLFALFALPNGWRAGESGAGRLLARIPNLVAESFRASAFY